MNSSIAFGTRTGKTIGTLGLFAGFASVAILLLFPSLLGQDRQSDTEPQSARQPLLEAAVASIAAESSGLLAEPVVRGAPPALGAGVAFNQADEQALPKPPDGYSLAGDDGDMFEGPIERRLGKAENRSNDGLDWLGSTSSIEDLVSQAAQAGRDWSFGWIRLDGTARPGDIAPGIEELGGRMLGSAGNLARARLPGDAHRLESIAALPGVGGLGALPVRKKLPGAFAEEVRAKPPSEQIPAFVTLMTGDPDGRWRRALEDLGAVVGGFDPDIRVYAANLTPEVLEPIAAQDFVLAIEPVGIVRAAHDTAVPAMGADALRTYLGSGGLFSRTAGASTPIAVMDSGLNVSHLDIASNRESICGANLVYFDALVDDEDLWVDERGHGTHVTGIIAGNGYVVPSFAGMAPSVKHIRIAKVLGSQGLGSDAFVLRGMDFLAHPIGCPGAGWSDAHVKPLIVNMSLSSPNLTHEGRGATARKLDSLVWSQGQLYVVSQGNVDNHGFSQYAAAKNSLAVGAIFDDGNIADFSSRGPTADGRLAPQVVGTGFDVTSAAGGGSLGGYVQSSGTSMASPAVAGVAALIMDVSRAYRGRPALTRARIMSSAIRPDAWLEDGTGFMANNSDGPGALQAAYGLGKASARTSILNRNRPDGWISGSHVSRISSGKYAYRDIYVPEGTSRLDLVVTWDEPPAETIAATVLHDLDLWLDRGVDCGQAECGEFASTSRIDNVEWIIVRNPLPGLYRAKVTAPRIYGTAPEAALSWTMIRGSSTPDLEIAAIRTVVDVGIGRRPTVRLTARANSYVAAGTGIHLDCRRVQGDACDSVGTFLVTTRREDGIEIRSEASLDSPIPVGELAVGETWQADLTLWDPGLDGGGAYRLYIKANGWNANPASTSVLVRRPGTGKVEPREAPAPSNDRFADADRLDGAEGHREVDLLRATTESGEPAYRGFPPRANGSVWYSWTAPQDGAVWFSVVANDRFSSPEFALVDAFRGEAVAALQRIGSGRQGVQFFAERGQAYLIRISYVGRAPSLRLDWAQGSRPANDDLGRAGAIAGVEGSVKGNNAGATLQPGELFGVMAATAWHRWRAPSDGAWEFRVNHNNLRALAFTGRNFADLRLVSGFPGASASFPARANEVYYIAVAAPDVHTPGGVYELSWSLTDRQPGNDDFGGATELPGAASASHGIGVDVPATVEPGEPEESGIRTKWWSWTAPADGDYTWLLDELTETALRLNIRLLVSVFEGDSLDELELVATNGPIMSVSLGFTAVAGQRYWISVGLPARDTSAYTETYRTGSATLVWGPTPENDDPAAAPVLAGSGGSVSGSTRFATIEAGERADLHGHSTLWWTFAAEESGWYRFEVAGTGVWTLTAYREAGDGSGESEVVGSSHWQRGEGQGTELLFQAEPGIRYSIAVGRRGGEGSGSFTLRWSESDAPAWLRYLGRLGDGDSDAAGAPVEIRGPGSLAFRGDGAVLYLASAIGLQVYERNSSTGELTLMQSLDDYLIDHTLIWDQHRNRLLAYGCGAWRAYPQSGDDPELGAGGALAVTGESGRCSGNLFMDSSGAFLYRTAEGQLELLAFEPSGGLRFVRGYQFEGQAQHAVIGADDSHVYAIAESVPRDLLQVFSRNDESGLLTHLESSGRLKRTAETVAVSDDGRYLFVFDFDGQSTRAFGLEDASRPNPTDFLAPFWNPPGSQFTNQCRFAVMRVGEPVADVLCDNLAYSVRLHPSSGLLEGTDMVADWQADRFRSRVPVFGAPESVAASPDGRHLYVSTAHQGILIFERVGNQPADAGSGSSDES